MTVNWNRRPEIVEAEHRYGDTSAWERQMEERDAIVEAEAHARDWDPEDMFPDQAEF